MMTQTAIANGNRGMTPDEGAAYRWITEITGACDDRHDPPPAAPNIPAGRTRFSWELQAICPRCGWKNFLMSCDDPGGRYFDRLAEHDYKALETEPVTCHECGRAFLLGEILID